MNSLFRDDLFNKTCRKIEDKNEARIIQDIARLIVFFAETFVIYEITHLDHLIEEINEIWIYNITMKNSLSKSNYFVEFKRFAFIDEQLKKFDSLIDNVFENFLFVAIYRMYFFFFICEIKCDVVVFDVVDRQNAHNMIVAVRTFVEIDEAREKIKSRNSRLFHLARSQIRENLRSLSRDRRRQNYLLSSFDSWI